MSKARIQLPEHLLDLPRSKWEEIIEEYIRDEDDRYIATRYYLDGVCLADIAEELVSAEEYPHGIYLVTMPGHITVVINGAVHDIFDCQPREMWCAWLVEK